MNDERTSPVVDVQGAVQERLAHAIERAQIGEDRELGQAVRERGEQLANLVYGLLRTSRLYAAENRAFDAPATELSLCIEWLTSRLGPVTLACVQDQVYVSDVRVRFGEKSGKPGELGVELAKHNVGSVTFHAAPGRDQLRAFVAAFALTPDPSSPRAAVARFLGQNGVRDIELGGINRFPKVGPRSESETLERDVREVVERADETVAQAWSNAAAGHMINALALRRLVSEILTVGLDNDGLWQRDESAPPHVAHAMRVNLLSLALGRAIGLAESVLQDLGVAAVLHDFGYAARAGAVSSLPHLAAHPPDGARMMAQRRGFHEAKVRRVLALLHHHRDFGDPCGKPSLFGRILRIAEDFDNYARADGGGLSPAEALVGMVPHAGTRYDPALMQLFVNVLGRFPPGTLLELDDGRVIETTSLVASPSAFATPRARVVRMPDGSAPRREVIVDLAVEGRPQRLLRSLPQAG